MLAKPVGSRTCVRPFGWVGMMFGQTVYVLAKLEYLYGQNMALAKHLGHSDPVKHALDKRIGCKASVAQLGAYNCACKA